MDMSDDFLSPKRHDMRPGSNDASTVFRCIIVHSSIRDRHEGVHSSESVRIYTAGRHLDPAHLQITVAPRHASIVRASGTITAKTPSVLREATDVSSCKR